MHDCNRRVRKVGRFRIRNSHFILNLYYEGSGQDQTKISQSYSPTFMHGYQIIIFEMWIQILDIFISQTLNLQLGSPFNYIWTMTLTPQLFWVASKFLNVNEFGMKIYNSKPLKAFLVRNAELCLAGRCKLSCLNHTRSGTLTATTCIGALQYRAVIYVLSMCGVYLERILNFWEFDFGHLKPKLKRTSNWDHILQMP